MATLYQVFAKATGIDLSPAGVRRLCEAGILTLDSAEITDPAANIDTSHSYILATTIDNCTRYYCTPTGKGDPEP